MTINWIAFIIFIVALFTTLLWVCDFVIALTKALAKVPNVDHGSWRAILAFVISVLWAILIYIV